MQIRGEKRSPRGQLQQAPRVASRSQRAKPGRSMHVHMWITPAHTDPDTANKVQHNCLRTCGECAERHANLQMFSPWGVPFRGLEAARVEPARSIML